MTAHDSFDHRPDPVIGRLLRDHVGVDDHEAFVARMRDAARQGRRSRQPAPLAEWELLARWFRPGIAAAAAILVGALIGAGLGERSASTASLAQTLGPAEAPAELLAAETPDPQVLLSPLLETP
jgi:hypothetical protein